jgi:hypothetical protein
MPVNNAEETIISKEVESLKKIVTEVVNGKENDVSSGSSDSELNELLAIIVKEIERVED